MSTQEFLADIVDNMDEHVMTQSQEDLHLLGLAANGKHVTPELVRAAYRIQALQVHPDKYQHCPEEVKAAAKDMMTRLNLAKERLTPSNSSATSFA